MRSEHLIVGRTRLDQRMDMTHHHLHHRFEIYLLMSGERFYFIDHKTYLIQPGDLVFINRYALHRTMDTGLGHHERVLIEFSSEFLHPLERQLFPLIEELFIEGGLVLRLQDKDRKKIEHLLLQILEETHDQKSDHDLSIRILLAQLLIWSARQTRLQQNNTLDDVFHPTLRDALEYISQRFRDSSLSLEDITGKFSISKYYFCRLFKKHTSYTFSQYVNLLRVREAQRLLRETNDKVIDIANQVGFENIHHFSRVFKQFSLLPPLRYRKSSTNHFS